jgi:hypothetical protein
MRRARHLRARVCPRAAPRCSIILYSSRVTGSGLARTAGVSRRAHETGDRREPLSRVRVPTSQTASFAREVSRRLCSSVQPSRIQRSRIRPSTKVQSETQSRTRQRSMTMPKCEMGPRDLDGLVRSIADHACPRRSISARRRACNRRVASTSGLGNHLGMRCVGLASRSPAANGAQSAPTPALRRPRSSSAR